MLRQCLFRLIQLRPGFPSLPDKTAWDISGRWTWTYLAYSEDDAAKDERLDVDILVAIDTTQTDDQLVMKMCSALMETHTPPPAILDFVLKIIRLRLGKDFSPSTPLPFMADLTQLPVQTCTILMNTVADILGREIKRFSPSEPIAYSAWMHDCLALLMARLPCLLSSKATGVLSRCFSGPHAVGIRGPFSEIVDRIVETVEPRDRDALCLSLQERFHYAFLNFSSWQLLDIMYNMMKKCCCRCNSKSGWACDTLDAVLKKHAETISVVLKEHTCDVLTGYLLHQMKTEVTWSRWHSEISKIVFREYGDGDGDAPTASWHGGFREFARHFMTSQKYIPFFFHHLFHRDYFDASAVAMFYERFFSSPGE